MPVAALGKGDLPKPPTVPAVVIVDLSISRILTQRFFVLWHVLIWPQPFFERCRDKVCQRTVLPLSSYANFFEEIGIQSYRDRCFHMAFSDQNQNF
jgi:hypothetical protein